MLFTLIENNVRVKEILKEQSFNATNIDNIDNDLFGEKFDEKFVNITNAKQNAQFLKVCIKTHYLDHHLTSRPFDSIPEPV